MGKQKRLGKDFVAYLHHKATSLTRTEQRLLPSMGQDGSISMEIHREAYNWICSLLTARDCRKLSEVYQKQLSGLVNLCVEPKHQTQFYYALDEMNCFQMTEGMFRPSMRSQRYVPFIKESVWLLWAYARLRFYGASLSEVLTGKVSEEIYQDAREESFRYSGILAAQIDLGDKDIVLAVREVLLGENNTRMISHELIRGIVKSKDRGLYQVLGDLLLAARLQEGVRQAVCETMDAGRSEAFLFLLDVIIAHDLIRYSSVKRAVSTWIGICEPKSIERISQKLLQLMAGCLKEHTFCEEQLRTEDSVAICCALWAKGFYDADEAVHAIQRLAEDGTRNQLIIASYYVGTLQSRQLQQKAAKKIWFTYPGDLELAACYLPYLLGDVLAAIADLMDYHTCGCYRYGYAMSYDKGAAPKQITSEKLLMTHEEAERSYQMLREIREHLPKKGIDFHPCMIPSWYQVKLTDSEIVAAMCLLAWVLQEKEYLDEAAAQIPSMKDGRHLAARLLLHRPDSEVRRNLLFTLLRNPETHTREVAARLLSHLRLTEEEYQKVEESVGYKKSQALALTILKDQKPEALKGCIGRLLKEKTEEAHLGALELSQYMKEKMSHDYPQVIPLLRAYENPTEKEQILLRELVGESHEVEDILKTPGYGLYQKKTIPVIPEVTTDIRQAEHLFAYGDVRCIQILECLEQLIEEHKEDEYRDIQGEEQLLGVKLVWYRYERESLDNFPLLSLWKQFYQTEIKEPELLLEVYLYFACLSEKEAYLRQKELYRKVFGRLSFEKMIKELRYREQTEQILRILFRIYVSDAQKGHWALAGMAKLFTVQKERTDGLLLNSCIRLPIFKELYEWLSYAKEDWESAFSMQYRIRPTIASFVQSYLRGIWTKDMLYKALFREWKMEELVQAVSVLRSWNGSIPWGVSCREMNIFLGFDFWNVPKGFDPRKDAKAEYVLACELYEELIPLILKVELRRGEQETPFSKSAIQIQAVYGIETLLQILTALGKEPLLRGYARYGTSKPCVLSHLLKVSYPKEGERGEDLKRAIKGTSITRKRLAEVAMYAPQWIPLLSECLNIPGLFSGCYYFMAHTAEWITEPMMAMIARYTPLSREELCDGAFALPWFFEAYKALGEKDFKLLYDAAKYSAVSSAHARARKYADAALGKTTYQALTEEIDKKRNKDLLMSLGLLPLPEEKEEKEAEILKRYQYILQYQKESRQFGAQRRVSEKRAADMAMQNLSTNAGFDDVMRLVLRMENQMLKEIQPYFLWQEVEGQEIKVQVSVEETGKVSLLCEREGKVLKSVPAKYKKDETVVACQKVVKKLREQHRRTKKMFEQAMEERTVFEMWELFRLFEHPVLRTVAEGLIYRTTDDRGLMGSLTEQGLVDLEKKVIVTSEKEKVWIAHPLDFYRAGNWARYQRELFDKKVKQPFKQVFRELYVKLPEELLKEESKLFAGYQIQPAKTVATLRERKWIADYEEGLQKIYYKDNVVAVIYALADWFSPADIEAPTLEAVEFYERKGGRRLRIEEVPDLIYSEVMRDVDLAVSVAYVGGVDPEASHSTVEMRRVIVKENLRLLKVENVSIKGNHAWIKGRLGEYTIHLGSGVVHQVGNAMLHVVPVHSQYRGKIFLPFVDEEWKTAEVVSKVLMFANDFKIKDPGIIAQIR